MSADYGNGYYKGYRHERGGNVWIHVTHVATPGEFGNGEDPLGEFSREEIIELVELAEQAWPGLTRDLAVAWFAKARDELLANVHFHSSTGQENIPCLCDQPGTYARQAPNPLAPDF